jgi:hypothetical protein
MFKDNAVVYVEKDSLHGCSVKHLLHIAVVFAALAIITSCSNSSLSLSKDDTRVFAGKNAGKHGPSFSIGIIPASDQEKAAASASKSPLIKSLKPFTSTSYSAGPGTEKVLAVELKAPRMQWYTFYPEEGKQGSLSAKQLAKKNPWDQAHEILKQYVTEYKKSGIEPYIVVEPDFLNTDPEKEAKLRLLNEGSAKAVTIDKPAAKVWPGRGIGWYLNHDKSQLAAARKYIDDAQLTNKNRIKIGHLDTGYSPKDPLLPKYFNKNLSKDFTQDIACNGSNAGGIVSDDEDMPSHGMRTLSVLAGNWLQAKDPENGQAFNGYLGGNPFAEVREYRIARKWVVHFRPKKMTAAIECAIKNHLDVLSISAGGFPIISQRSAINDAYDNGVAIFAATGDFYVLPIIHVSTPKTVAFPARYTRVLGVAGVTADNKSYGDSPCLWCQFEFWDFKQTILPWMFRGSYGPQQVMQGHVVSAYTPNITNSRYYSDEKYGIGLNGGGTSNSTPQVAAAASLWLQKERAKLEEHQMWHTWRQAEAVYRAIIQSSRTNFDGYSVEKFGAGILQADSLMKISYSKTQLENMTRKERSSIGYRWVYDLINSTNLLVGTKKFKIATLDMLTTEALQLVYNSSKFNEIINKLESCVKTNKSTAICDANKKLYPDLLKDILDKKNISQTLRDYLTKRLSQLS